MKYEIKGDNLPVVLCHLEAGEEMTCEGGSMSWMDDEIEMKTQAGGIGKALGRMFTGEKMFQNKYIAKSAGEIAFASSFPGSIRAVEVTPDKPVVAQKGAFLASYGDIEVSVFFQKKIGAGFFGGEGFLMQKYSGNGIVFLEIDGSAIEYDIPAGVSGMQEAKAVGDGRFLLDGSGYGQGCEEHLPRRRGSVQHRGQRSRTHHSPDHAGTEYRIPALQLYAAFH